MKSPKSSIGYVKSIYVAANAGIEMSNLTEVEAREGCGLVGDRYASKLGYWQTPKSRQTIQDVSFIRASDIENSGFSEPETRRNIVVQTEFKLVDLIERHFYVGEVLFKGIEECTPCQRPSDLSGKENFARIFKNKGGLRAQVIKSGFINEMDPIVVVE